MVSIAFCLESPDIPVLFVPTLNDKFRHIEGPTNYVAETFDFLNLLLRRRLMLLLPSLTQ